MFVVGGLRGRVSSVVSSSQLGANRILPLFLFLFSGIDVIVGGRIRTVPLRDGENECIEWDRTQHNVVKRND